MSYTPWNILSKFRLFQGDGYYISINKSDNSLLAVNEAANMTSIPVVDPIQKVESPA